jgi:hypothetical protein
MSFLLFTGCGYRLAARKGDAGQGQTIAVPTFLNRSTTYRVEQKISEALRQELTRSTRYHVTSDKEGDVVIAGEVLSYAPGPVVFTEQGQASQYSMSVDLKIVITDSKSGAVLFRNERMSFREIFQLARNPADFVPEDPAAFDRLASKFASAVVAALVHRNP